MGEAHSSARGDAATRWLWWATTLHLLLAVVLLPALLLPYEPVLGVSPLLKPLKFAISIAILLGTFALVLPSISMRPWARALTAFTLVWTMVVEMVCITAQGLRGRASHFNVDTPLDAVVWELMRGAIVVASLTFVVVAIAASRQPLVAASGAPLPPSLALAIRAGLWILMGTVVSGFAMGSRMSHSIGGVDGGEGLALLGWSVHHGDLRVAHFVSLHAMQALPLLAWGLESAGVGKPRARVVVVAIVTAAWVGLVLVTFAFAALGRPVLG